MLQHYHNPFKDEAFDTTRHHTLTTPHLDADVQVHALATLAGSLRTLQLNDNPLEADGEYQAVVRRTLPWLEVSATMIPPCVAATCRYDAMLSYAELRVASKSSILAIGRIYLPSAALVL